MLGEHICASFFAIFEYITSSNGIEKEWDFFGDFLRIGGVTLDFNLRDSSRVFLLSEFMQLELDLG